MGALGVALAASEAGLDARVGGVTWERRPVDPIPGPRRIDEIADAEPVADGVVLAGPRTRGPGGFLFAESNMARVLGEPVVLLDPGVGPARAASALDAAAARTGCDLVVLVDVGGDVLAHGHEAGLASPLCDAVLLAASAHMQTPVLAAVFGAGCDGELLAGEVLERVAEVASVGGWLGAAGITPQAVERLEAAVAEVPTEASAQALACARGAHGPAPIRDGRRVVHRSPIGALTFFLDAAIALRSAARLAAAVVDCGSLEEADDRLRARGLRTELQYEQEMAAGAEGPAAAAGPPAP